MPPATPDSTPVSASTAAPEGRFVTFPDSPFQLWQPYPPAGDQPTAIAHPATGQAIELQAALPPELAALTV